MTKLECGSVKLGAWGRGDETAPFAARAFQRDLGLVYVVLGHGPEASVLLTPT